MLDALNSEPMRQTVLILRPANKESWSFPYMDKLKSNGLEPLECTPYDIVSKTASTDCRVGLLIVTHESELARLDKCEPSMNNGNMLWVGLVMPPLVSMARMREFIGEYLFNYLTIPVDPDHLLLTLRHAWRMSHMRNGRNHLQSEVAVGNDVNMVGKSPRMQSIFAQIQKVARTDASVLITGPSGTGKEVAARSIHQHSSRCRAPFVAVNCGAITPSLFQSELFGHEKGAFTGASQRKAGRIEAAQGGTLFLDEIGDIPLDMQVSLLRFLQEKTIERVGGTDTLEIDVRVIAATHIDLAEAVRQGRFREDLYYRINVVCIDVPPLSERGQDIEYIAKYYFAKFASVHNKSLRGFSSAAMNAMLAYPWPGNVRELVNRVQRATVMAEGRFIQPEDLGLERHEKQAYVMSLEDIRAAAESLAIRRALAQSHNRISRAASLLGISRMTLYRLIEKHNIRSPAMPDGQKTYLETAQRDIEICG